MNYEDFVTKIYDEDIELDNPYRPVPFSRFIPQFGGVLSIIQNELSIFIGPWSASSVFKLKEREFTDCHYRRLLQLLTMETGFTRHGHHNTTTTTNNARNIITVSGPE